MMIDPWTAQALAWTAVWASAGLIARQQLARAARRQEHRSTGSAGKGGQ